MRVYMRGQDGRDMYSELDHSKVKLMPGDFLITHDEDSWHEAQGLFFLDGIGGVNFPPPAKKYSLDKQVSALVFFTKLPHSVSIKRNTDSVRMTVTM